GRQVRLARAAGALDQLPILLGALGTAAVWAGDFAEAAALIAEADAVCVATGTRSAPFTAMMLASFRGDRAEAEPLIEGTIADASAAGRASRWRTPAGWPPSSATASAGRPRRWPRPS